MEIDALAAIRRIVTSGPLGERRVAFRPSAEARQCGNALPVVRGSLIRTLLLACSIAANFNVAAAGLSPQEQSDLDAIAGARTTVMASVTGILDETLKAAGAREILLLEASNSAKGSGGFTAISGMVEGILPEKECLIYAPGYGTRVFMEVRSKVSQAVALAAGLSSEDAIKAVRADIRGVNVTHDMPIIAAASPTFDDEEDAAATASTSATRAPVDPVVHQAAIFFRALSEAHEAGHCRLATLTPKLPGEADSSYLARFARITGAEDVANLIGLRYAYKEARRLGAEDGMIAAWTQAVGERMLSSAEDAEHQLGGRFMLGAAQRIASADPAWQQMPDLSNVTALIQEAQAVANLAAPINAPIAARPANGEIAMRNIWTMSTPLFSTMETRR